MNTYKNLIVERKFHSTTPAAKLIELRIASYLQRENFDSESKSEYNEDGESVELKGEYMATDNFLLAFGYFRLSQEDMRMGESSSISNQRLIVSKYCKDNGILLVDEFVEI